MLATMMPQRPLRGSRISTFYPVKDLPSLASLDSAFQLQEYISLLIRLDVHDVEAIVSVPGKSSLKDKEKAQENGADDEKDADKERKSDIAVDEACWIYEQLRRLAQDLTHPLITTLQQECTRASCPEMKAGEWLYLCVAHGDDGAREQCCAIDYILHTLDSATALLNSPRAFPSRLSIPQTSHRHFSSLARRLGRIFAHAFFHHREAFEQAEAESSLYARFLALTSKFDLVPTEFLVIPPTLGHVDGENLGRDVDVQPPTLLGAAIHPQPESDVDRQPGLTLDSVWEQEKERAQSRSPPGLGHPPGTDSPRKIGRNRTDTMIFSEAISAVEELAKGDTDSDAGPVETVVELIPTIDQPPSSDLELAMEPTPVPEPSVSMDADSSEADLVPSILVPIEPTHEASAAELGAAHTEPLPPASSLISETSADTALCSSPTEKVQSEPEEAGETQMEHAPVENAEDEEGQETATLVKGDDVAATTLAESLFPEETENLIDIDIPPDVHELGLMVDQIEIESPSMVDLELSETSPGSVESDSPTLSVEDTPQEPLQDIVEIDMAPPSMTEEPSSQD